MAPQIAKGMDRALKNFAVASGHIRSLAWWKRMVLSSSLKIYTCLARKDWRLVGLPFPKGNGSDGLPENQGAGVGANSSQVDSDHLQRLRRAGGVLSVRHNSLAP